MKKSINIVNKKAKFEYSFLETLIVGIQLVGSEVKSIRQGKVSISEGYCYFNNSELFIKGMNISDYGFGSFHETLPKKKRNKYLIITLKKHRENKLNQIGI